MTIGKLFGNGLILAFVIALLKLIFFYFLNIDSIILLGFLYILVFIFTTSAARRLGIINYLESFIVIAFWLVFSMFVDIFIFGLIFGLEPYRRISFWITYFILILSIFLTHKKRHIDIRKGGQGK